MRRCGFVPGVRVIRSVTWVGIAWPMVSHTTMSSAPVGARVGGDADDAFRIGQPLEGQVNAVAMHSWIAPPTSWLIRTASGIAATLSSVVRPMLALLWESDAEKQYWKLRAPAAAAFSTCRGVATQIQHRSSSSGVERGDDVERVGQWRDEVGPRHRADLQRRHAECQQLTDDFHLAVGGQALRGELKSVAQGHVAQFCLRWCGTGSMVSCECSDLVVGEVQQRRQHFVGVFAEVGSDASDGQATARRSPARCR